MIIPVRCFSCNKIIGSKYNAYIKLNQLYNSNDDDIITVIETDTIDEKIKNSKIMFEKLGIDRMCCTRHLLTHVDLVKKI
uniref:DNA-directed RNA polymerase subunit N n=1 Tax=viral metagenome TaxID=1070528 RepID=A0A6C0EKK6_9ZZZZ